MKPDGVSTAALESMEALESNPVNEAAPAAGQELNQAASPVEEEVPQKPSGEPCQEEPQGEKAKDPPAGKTSNKASGDSKAKTANKPIGKTKTGTTNPAKTTPGLRTNTTQSRISNGVSKPQTNGVAKKPTGPADKKSNLTSAPSKRPTGTAGSATAKSTMAKVGEKKATGTPANGAKSTSGTTAAKKTTATTANGVKSSTAAAAARKPPAPKTTSATPTKPSSTASPKTPVSKATKPPVGTPTAPRPATGSTRPPTSSTAKSSSATAKPATPKTPATQRTPATAKTAAPKSTSTTPSGGKPPASQTSRTTTPLKKDATKPTTPGARKPADSPLTRPSTKSTKPETPKSASKKDVVAKKPPANKAADTKTPNSSKPQDSKATPSAKAPRSKPAATKTSAPKKMVGSSTPTPVKRGPRAATATEPEKEVAAAIAAAAAIATAAAVIAAPQEPEAEPPAVGPVEPSSPTLGAVTEQTPEFSPEPLPEPLREPTPKHVREVSPEPAVRVLSQAPAEPEPVHEPAYGVQLSAQMDPFMFEAPANDSVSSLGTTVMSPPCSPPGAASPVREPEDASSLLDLHAQSDPWDRNQVLAPSDPVGTLNFQTHQEKDIYQQVGGAGTREEEEDEEDEKENLFMPPSVHAPAAFQVAPHQFLGASPQDNFTQRGLMSPHEKEEAVEKADQEINEDDDEDEDDEEEEQRRLGHQPSSLTTDMSTSQPSEEFLVRSSGFGGSAGWHGDDFLSGMDSEDVSSCTSSRQQGVSDLSSTQHTAILEGTQSSDALVDTSLRGSEGDGNFMGSPNVETLANEEEEDEDDERVDDMDLSSERVEEHHKAFQEDEDEDVEMRSEGVTESCGNADEDDFNEEDRGDNLNRSGPPPCVPPATTWGQTNPFADTWAQPASLFSVSSPSPVSDHGAADSEVPAQSPARACVDSSAPSFSPQSEQNQMKDSASAEAHGVLAAPAVGMSQSSTLSGTAPAAHSSSETSTPEDLRDYDSSSGVESRSDKQQTPVPAPLQSDVDQDLGIHLEKGDGEEEEAETLPADEVLGTGPPTAPASAPSSPSTSGDEASDTEGEMQINDPDAPMTMDESAGFESPTPTRNLPALDEDEEARDTPAPDGEEDGGGTTPQSANSVASYGFDCTTSNSNAHSMAESCGKSPGIFSLENEEQLPEEAKDPSLIKELTLPPAAASAHADNLLGRPVDLMPLGHLGENHPALGDHHHHYMLGGKVPPDHLEDVDPLEPRQHMEAQGCEEGSDSQPPYYSTICDKTDSFLAGDKKRQEADGDFSWQTHSQQDNQNQNYAASVPIANGHYLALVPGNRRPIDPSLAAHFTKIAPPPPPPSPPPPPAAPLADADARAGGEQLRRLEQHQEKLKEMQQRQEQERQKRQWLEEERLRLEQQKQLERQRRELLQLQLQQQQQEHRHRRQVLQWQLELEQQYRMQQKQIQQQQQLRRSPTGVMISPSSGLCTIYEAMETSDEEDDARGEHNRNAHLVARRTASTQVASLDFHRQLRPLPPQELEWNRKVDMVQQLINQTLMLSGDGGCPPLLLLPVGTGGTLSPLESSMWPHLLPQFSPPAATVTSVSSYSPDNRGSSPPGDWTVVEVETQH